MLASLAIAASVLATTRLALADSALDAALDDSARFFVMKDYTNAAQAARRAIETAPQSPLGYYTLGVAERAGGHFADAEAAWTKAESLVGNDDLAHARILFALADLAERQKKWPEARAAWQRLIVQANGRPAFFPTTASVRIQVIDTILERDKAAELVRKRIAARAAKQ
jgi:cytochrome c-type biogenesis protein CcmH/NrfG